MVLTDHSITLYNFSEVFTCSGRIYETVSVSLLLTHAMGT